MLRQRVWLVIAMTVLAACGSAPPPTGNRQLTIGFVFIADDHDLGYSQAIWEGSEALARAMPDTHILRVAHVPETGDAAEQAMESLIRRGATIIFATSYGYLDAAFRVAKRHPDVTVLHQGGIEKKPQLDNFGTYWGTMEEPVYQSGIVAGAATKTGVLGFVAAFPIPAVFNNINAFLLGARTVRPDATVHVRFTGSWCNPPVQEQAALALIREGADVLTQHQDCTRTVLDAAEHAGIRSIGYHEDGSQEAPHGYLVGAVWSWSDLLVDIVRTIREGRFVTSRYNHDFRGGLATGDNPFVLSEMSPLVSARTRALVAGAETRMRAGWSPFTGPITDRDGHLRVPAGQTPTRAEIDAMNYLVTGVVGSVPASH
ncbi:MAG: basic rane lipoprotein [Marmoricola sp.]|nr:basic rane lipoprotein [Marmoricola sp.]